MDITQERIAQLMKTRNISYAELAKLTNLPKSTLQRYVSGTTRKISSLRLLTISRALNVSPTFLLGLTSNEEEFYSVAEFDFLQSKHDINGNIDFENVSNESMFSVTDIKVLILILLEQLRIIANTLQKVKEKKISPSEQDLQTLLERAPLALKEIESTLHSLKLLKSASQNHSDTKK